MSKPIDLERKDFYMYSDKSNNKRTKKRLQELKNLGLVEVGIAEFGIVGFLSGIYIENIWTYSPEKWNDYLGWIKEILSKKHAKQS